MGWCTECAEGLAETNPCYLCTLGQELHRVPQRLTKSIFIIATLRIVLSFVGVIWFAYRAIVRYGSWETADEKEEENIIDSIGENTVENNLQRFYLSLWEACLFLIMIAQYGTLYAADSKRSPQLCIAWMWVVLPAQLLVLIKFLVHWNDFEYQTAQLAFWIISCLIQYWELWIVIIYYEELKRGEEADLGKTDDQLFTEVDNEFDRILNQRLDDHTRLEEAHGFRTSYEFAEAYLAQYAKNNK